MYANANRDKDNGCDNRPELDRPEHQLDVQAAADGRLVVRGGERGANLVRELIRDEEAVGDQQPQRNDEDE